MEKYINNEQNTYYRCWVFRERIVLVEMSNPDLVKKMGRSRLLRHWTMVSSDGDISHASSSDYPVLMIRDLIKFKDRFLPDFGTIDVVKDDDERPFIIDVNTTPYYNVHLPIPHLIEHLGQGLTNRL